ncbi:helix-turn-helix transcriptional regulator [uncultured Microscilla sp.]|uniref:ArsR/SmtB family transcription factor n=1 Tax=uncultured Microscilla sp. TaxID=432653 RepID=UPI00261B58D9|nr:ArsR family transcriptional regulator [uncultured Microscilla sp.]
MDLKLATEIGKCLSNQTRVKIMEWLKEPALNFYPDEPLKHAQDGVCVTYIQEKAKLSQSTISTYLTNMEKCGLLIMTRHGKWSYFKRNEDTIANYCKFISNP